jgi:hypothetical protein
MNLGLNWQALCVPYSVLGYRSPVPLAKFQMALVPSTLISSGSKKKEPRYACLSEANISHSHIMWTEVSSSVPHFRQIGSLHIPMIRKCLRNVLCPVSRPITTQDCVLLKDYSRAPIAGSGPEINSRACLCALQGPRHNARCCLSIQRFIFLLIFCLETPKKGSGSTHRWAEPSLASLSAILFPLTLACPGTQTSNSSHLVTYKCYVHQIVSKPAQHTIYLSLTNQVNRKYDNMQNRWHVKAERI